MTTIIERLIPLADAHQAADEYLAGTYGRADGRACAIGCTIKDAVRLGALPADVRTSDHAALAGATGVPELLWRMLEHCFERSEDAERPSLTPRVLRALAAGTKHATLADRICARLMRKNAEDTRDAAVRAVSIRVATLYERRAGGDAPSHVEWEATRQQADAAWHQAIAAGQQADAAGQQADAAWHQAIAARWQASAARWQADAAWHQAIAAWHQVIAAGRDAAAQNPWGRWCADMLCEECAR